MCSDDVKRFMVLVNDKIRGTVPEKKVLLSVLILLISSAGLLDSRVLVVVLAGEGERAHQGARA